MRGATYTRISTAEDRQPYSLEAQAERLDLLLFYRVDRFSRSVRGLAQLLEDLDAGGVAFRSPTEPFDTTTAAGRMMVQMLAVFAGVERVQALLSERGEDYLKRVSATSPFLLAGLVVCARCGKHLVGTLAVGNRYRYRYYTYFTRQRYGAKYCDAERLPAEELDAAILDARRAASGLAPRTRRRRRRTLAGLVTAGPVPAPT